jgi:hypothetical protein
LTCQYERIEADDDHDLTWLVFALEAWVESAIASGIEKLLIRLIPPSVAAKRTGALDKIIVETEQLAPALESEAIARV